MEVEGQGVGFFLFLQEKMDFRGKLNICLNTFILLKPVIITVPNVGDVSRCTVSYLAIS